MSSRINITKGSARVKRTSIVAHVLQYKTKDIVVHPSMLTYFNNEPETDGQLELEIDRPKHHKYDFLLAPLEIFTEIIKIDEDLLLLISKHRIVLDKSTGEVKRFNEPMVYQKMTLKFASSGERDKWMDIIIAECNKVYLEDLIETSHFFDDKFIEVAHNEIWSHILLGDESLRRAYIAPAESDQWKLVNIVLIVVIEWLQALLGVRYLVPVHKKVFVELFSLMLQNPAARALFILVRPKEGFLLAFNADRVPGKNVPDKYNDDEDIEVEEVRNQVVTTKSFIREIKDRVQSSTWKQYRSFLMIINHPAMHSTTESSAVGEANLKSSGWGLAALMSLKKNSSHSLIPIDTSLADELAWCLGRTKSPTSEFTWEMMNKAVSDSSYLTYHFDQIKMNQNQSTMNDDDDHTTVDKETVASTVQV